MSKNGTIMIFLKKIIFLKLILFLSIFFLIINLSNKNLGFLLNVQNIFNIVLLDIYYLLYSIFFNYSYFVILIFLFLITSLKKFQKFLMISLKMFSKSHNLFFVVSAFFSIAIYNLGGYPLSFSGLSGRMFLLPSFMLISIFYFILISKKFYDKRNIKFAIYIFFIFGYLNSSVYFFEINYNQNVSFNHILQSTKNKNIKDLFLFTDKKTSFYEINLASYINDLYKRDFKNVYVYNKNERCIIQTSNKVDVYSKKSNFKKFILKSKGDNFKLQTLMIQNPHVLVDRNLTFNKNFNNCF